MGGTVQEVRRLQQLVKKTYSIEHPLGENNNYSLIDTIEDSSVINPADLLENRDQYSFITKWLESLKDNEREILMLRFGLNDYRQALWCNT